MAISGLYHHPEHHQIRITPNHVQKDLKLANLASCKEEIKSNPKALIWEDSSHICYPNALLITYTSERHMNLRLEAAESSKANLKKLPKSVKLKSFLEANSKAKLNVNQLLDHP